MMKRLAKCILWMFGVASYAILLHSEFSSKESLSVTNIKKEV